ncbi:MULTISPECIES: TRAP transporter large permease [Natrialbaceae]|uniref:TRAP transporter large permease n=1 Tax=Natrialbaceae TaxID=1644061 RepID=UPI00207CD5D6|nr:TRAP transporter large permease [Natronococcus sp. CG52]
MSEIFGVMVVAAFLLLLLLRFPVAIALLAPSIGYVLWAGEPITIVAQRVVYALNSYTVLTIPLFIYVGSLLNHADFTTKIFKFSNKLVGGIRGGLAQVNIIASLIFSGMSGAALADIGGVGRAMIYAMEEYNYDSAYAAAITAASATAGPIFPPSIPLIIYGLLAEESILALFMAGIIPALMTVVLLMITTYFISVRRDFPTVDPDEKVGWSGFSYTLPAVMTPVILIAGMLAGLFGPSEVAAITVLYVIAINVFVYRNVSTSYIMSASRESVRTTSIILFIVAAAALFAWVMSVTRMAPFVTETILGTTTNPIIVLLIMNLIILVTGLFLETIAALVMITPLLLPVATQIGIDPIHFGMIIVFNLMIGLMTPPFGLSLFLSSQIAEVPVEETIKQILPYYIPLFAVLFIITFYPETFMWTIELL